MSDMRIATALWFETAAEQAVAFYAGLFDDATITKTTRFGEAGPGPAGSVMSVEFVLRGQRFLAINGGPTYRLTPAASILVTCETQEEIDGLWEKLIDGGRAMQCGWLEDRFGLTWQIVPAGLDEMLGDEARSPRVFEAMMPMVKLDKAALEAAYRGS